VNSRCSSAPAVGPTWAGRAGTLRPLVGVPRDAVPVGFSQGRLFFAEVRSLDGGRAQQARVLVVEPGQAPRAFEVPQGFAVAAPDAARGAQVLLTRLGPVEEWRELVTLD
jgi:hypothetical protein